MWKFSQTDGSWTPLINENGNVLGASNLPLGVYGPADQVRERAGKRKKGESQGENKQKAAKSTERQRENEGKHKTKRRRTPNERNRSRDEGRKEKEIGDEVRERATDGEKRKQPREMTPLSGTKRRICFDSWFFPVFFRVSLQVSPRCRSGAATWVDVSVGLLFIYSLIVYSKGKKNREGEEFERKKKGNMLSVSSSIFPVFLCIFALFFAISSYAYNSTENEKHFFVHIYPLSNSFCFILNQ